MKRGGLLLFALVLATGALRMAAPTGPQTMEGESRNGKKETQKLKNESKPGNADVKAALRGTDIQKLISQFLGIADEAPTPKPESQSNSVNRGVATTGDKNLKRFLTGVQSKGNEFRFAIAFLPDPVHTHLGLMFDRGIEAIQQGAQKLGCSFDRATMPWDPEQHAESANIAERTKAAEATEAREAWPGLMIFRKAHPEETPEPGGQGDTEQPAEKSVCADKNLFVFVVGETPTGGIEKEQFRRALALIEIFEGGEAKANREPFYFLGPSFSGSLTSLDVALGTNQGQLHGRTLTIFSGTITSAAAQEWFTAESAKKYGADFVSFQQNDESLIRQFVDFACKQGYHEGDIAVLSEDETDYGAVAKTRQEKPIASCVNREKRQGAKATDEGRIPRYRKLYFPREISQMRSAYQTAMANSAAGNRGTTSLPLDLQTTGNDDDTVPIFSRSQTPLSQEAVMLELTARLHKHRTKLVLLLATDPMDQLFLAQYLRRAFPPARIGVTSPDMLFGREGDNLLHGTFGIAAYSLAAGSGDNLCRSGLFEKKPEEPIFPNTLSQGTYNATVGLLRAMVEPTTEAKNRTGRSLKLIPAGPYAEYGSGTETPEHGKSCELVPQTQITVLGREGFWAVTTVEKNSASSLRPQAGEGKRPEQGARQHAPMSLNFATVIVLLMCLIHAWFSIGSTLFSPMESQAQFVQSEGREAGSRESLLVVGGLVLCSGLMLLISARWPATKSDERFGSFVEPALLAAYLIFGAAVVWDLWRRKARAKGLVYGVGALSIFISGIYVTKMAPNQIAWLSSSRSLHLTNGCSPLLPILFLLVAVYWWSWYGLRGMVLTDSHRPRLPENGDMPTGYYRLREGDETRPLFAACRPLSISRQVLGLMLIATLLFVLTPDYKHPIQTLEGLGFDWGFFVLLSITSFLLIWTLLKLLQVWMETRRILSGIDRTHLRSAFADLTGFQWATMWSASGSTLREAYRFVARQQESLRRLQANIGDLGSLVPGRQELMPAVKSQVNETVMCANRLREFIENLMKGRPQRTGRWDIRAKYQTAYGWKQKSKQVDEAFTCLQKSSAKTTGVLLTAILDPLWDKARNIVAGETPKFIQNKEWNTGAGIAKKMAAEYAALTYASFVAMLVARIRSLVLSAVGIYAFLLLSISVYPFEPNPALFSVGVALLLLGAAVVGYVYVQMHKDAMLSQLTNTKEGELDGQFWIQILGAGAIPVLTLLAGQFPAVNQIVVGLLEPALQALK